jgi:hypothetical protein
MWLCQEQELTYKEYGDIVLEHLENYTNSIFSVLKKIINRVIDLFKKPGLLFLKRG